MEERGELAVRGGILDLYPPHRACPIRVELLGDEVVVFAHRPTVPCMYNERKMDRPGFVESCWDVAGVSCEVLVGGQLRAGDAVRIDSALDVERIDELKPVVHVQVSQFILRLHVSSYRCRGSRIVVDSTFARIFSSLISTDL